MANWIRGSVNVTGKKEDVERFLEEDLISERGKFYIKGTKRQYVWKEENTIFTECNDDKQRTRLDYEGAWSIDAEGFKDVSKEFKVDFEIYGCEHMGGFSQEVEIENGLIIKDTKEDCEVVFLTEEEMEAIVGADFLEKTRKSEEEAFEKVIRRNKENAKKDYIEIEEAKKLCSDEQHQRDSEVYANEHEMKCPCCGQVARNQSPNGAGILEDCNWHCICCDWTENKAINQYLKRGKTLNELEKFVSEINTKLKEDFKKVESSYKFDEEEGRYIITNKIYCDENVDKYFTFDSTEEYDSDLNVDEFLQVLYFSIQRVFKCR